MTRHPTVELLDCTLRDGSYVVDFHFTVKDTVLIAAALERAGLRWIEIGHGLGLRASEQGYGTSAASDEEYLRAASQALTQAAWGTFFMTGVGREDDLRMAASYGMHFVRIGVNATEVDQARRDVEMAKRLGLSVSVNLMKSYVVPPDQLAAHGQRAVDYGADMVCLVDSAGSMLPQDVQAYAEALAARVGVPLGFHAHNNLGLALANALTAASHGVQRIDATLQGLGRGGGNAATEVLVALLLKQGIDPGVRLQELLEVSARLVRPFVRDRGYDPLAIVSGYAGFHSSHLKTVLKYAGQYRVDPHELILALCDVDRVHAPEPLVEQLAKHLASRTAGAPAQPVELPEAVFLAGETTGPRHEPSGRSVRHLAAAIRASAVRSHLQSVLNVVSASDATTATAVSPVIQEEYGFVIGSVEVGALEQLRNVVAAADGVVDVLLVDADVRPYVPGSLAALAGPLAAKSRVIPYQDRLVWWRSVDRQATDLLGASAQRLVIQGTDSMALKFALARAEQGHEVTLTGSVRQTEATAAALRCFEGGAAIRITPDPVDACRGATLLASFDRRESSISIRMIDVLAPGAVILDAGIGCVEPDALSRAHARGLRIVRPDMRPALAAELRLALDGHRLIRHDMGREEIAGVPVVAGGLIGQRGDVVVDSMASPTRTLGIADGQGRLLQEVGPDWAERLRRVERELMRRQLLSPS